MIRRPQWARQRSTPDELAIRFRRVVEDLLEQLERDDYKTGYRRGFAAGEAYGRRAITDMLTPNPNIRTWGRWAKTPGRGGGTA